MSSKCETENADVLPRQLCIPEPGPEVETVVLLLEQAACLQKRVPSHTREPGAPHVMPVLTMERGTALDKQHGSLPLFSGTGIDTRRCSDMNSLSTQELFQYSAIRRYNCRQGGEESALRAVILHYYLPFSTSKRYRLVFQHFLSQGCVGSAWSLGYGSPFFLAWDERVPLETLFTCLICILSPYNLLSSIVCFLLVVFLMDAWILQSKRHLQLAPGVFECSLSQTRCEPVYSLILRFFHLVSKSSSILSPLNIPPGLKALKLT